MGRRINDCAKNKSFDHFVQRAAICNGAYYMNCDEPYQFVYPLVSAHLKLLLEGLYILFHSTI